MSDVLDLVLALVPAIAIGYLLGALPLADRLSRRRGIDLFSTGTGLSGATNVARSVGKLPGLIVFVWDMAKGTLAVTTAGLLGVEGSWVLLPVAAAVVGHWKPVFTGFRGGDGLATLGGAIIALFPVFGPICIGVAMVVSLGGQRLPYSSLVSVVLGYATLLALTLTYEGDTALAVGIGGLAALVLAIALNGHRQRRQELHWSDFDGSGWDGAGEVGWDEANDTGNTPGK